MWSNILARLKTYGCSTSLACVYLHFCTCANDWAEANTSTANTIPAVSQKSTITEPKRRLGSGTDSVYVTYHAFHRLLYTPFFPNKFSSNVRSPTINPPKRNDDPWTSSFIFIAPYRASGVIYVYFLLVYHFPGAYFLRMTTLRTSVRESPACIRSMKGPYLNFEVQL